MEGVIDSIYFLKSNNIKVNCSVVTRKLNIIQIYWFHIDVEHTVLVNFNVIRWRNIRRGSQYGIIRTVSEYVFGKRSNYFKARRIPGMSSYEAFYIGWQYSVLMLNIIQQFDNIARFH
jgi:hypothetical protein